jgi:PAS domain S-box-containing protein
MGVHRPDGALTWISINAVLIGSDGAGAKGVVTSFVDITGRRRAELAQRESEERLRSLAENMPGIITMIDRTGTILYINRVLSGFDRATVLGTNTYGYIRPAYAAAYRAIMERVFATGEVGDIEIEGDGADGATAWYLSRLAPIRSAGRIIAVVVTTEDVTDRKRAEDERRAFQREREALLERLQMQMDRNPIGCIIWDAHGRYGYVNPAAERIFGFGCAELVGQTHDLIVPPAARGAVDDIFARLARGDMGADSVNENVTKDGRTITCEWHNTPMFDGSGAFIGAMSMVQDISARRQLEDQYRQAQKMEAIGKLAGGVAHDFNNLLTAIMGYGEMVLARRGLDEVAQGHIRQITKAGRRAAALTQQLLAYSRKQVLQPRIFNLNGVVADMNGLLHRLIGEHIELRTDLDAQLWQVRADPNQFEQVLMNLAINARDAMAGGGVLTISTANVSLDAAGARAHPDLAPGDHVRLRVVDNGAGMDAAVMERIFEPFFTTKKAGEGTGLGLSMVFGVVKQSGGAISVTSQTGHGSAFEILLPRSLDAESPAPRRSEHGLAVMGSETVLVVEDDEDVRALVRETLASSGYQVLEARDGQQAVDISEHFPRAIDLLVSDMVMPRLGGRELMVLLRRQRPGLRVLLMSGYVDDVSLSELTPQAGINFIEKPFTAPALLGKIRQVLS